MAVPAATDRIPAPAIDVSAPPPERRGATPARPAAPAQPVVDAARRAGLPPLTKGAGPIRLMVASDVPELTNRARSLLEAQERVTLATVVSDASDVVAQVQSEAPDVVLLDALMGGGRAGVAIAKAMREAGSAIPIVMATVPDRPLSVSGMGLVEVLTHPIDGVALIAAAERAHQAHRGPAALPHVRSCLVYAGKGGVGKTTIAHNLATRLAAHEGARIALVDGAVRSSDLRLQLHVPDDAPSMLQLPTTRPDANDLEEIMWRDPSGVDVLLAPARVEQAELVTAREISAVLKLLDQLYDIVVIDAPTAIDGMTLVLLDAVEVIVNVVTPERNAVRNAKRSLELLATAGFPRSQMVTVLNRSDAPGLDHATISTELGGDPDLFLPNDPDVAVRAEMSGAPIVSTEPDGPLAKGFAALADRIANPVARHAEAAAGS